MMIGEGLTLSLTGIAIGLGAGWSVDTLYP